MAKIEPIIIKMDPEALETLKRIADALEAQNAQKPDTSFGDRPQRPRLIEHDPAQPWITWTQERVYSAEEVRETGGEFLRRMSGVTHQGEGDHLLNPEADHTGEETD